MDRETVRSRPDTTAAEPSARADANPANHATRARPAEFEKSARTKSALFTCIGTGLSADTIDAARGMSSSGMH
jgi:hypothetical protein